jgi:hypothetical protein
VAKAYLIELDKRTDAPAKGYKDNASYTAFQYFPESLSDGKAINYQQKDIPGGSLPLYQWISSGERLVSFTAVFTCDVDYMVSLQSPDTAANIEARANFSMEALQGRLKSAGQIQRNPDLRGAIAWLRRYMLPSYNGDNSSNITQAPNKLRLFLPNSGLGLTGGSDLKGSSIDSIYCVMTQCEATYESFFQSGLPRVVTVSLAFAQIPQFRGGVYFPHANEGSGIQNMAASYTNLFPR